MISRSFTDQMGTKIILQSRPVRIVSLVPSQTELLYDLGLDKEVAGITKFCVHPPYWHKSKRIIGGTKNFRFKIIDEIIPDLIIGNREENYPEGIAQLREKYPVWMSNVVLFSHALDMISSLGELTGKETRASGIIEKIREAFDKLKKRSGQKVLYLIWRNPWMAAASGTFIHAMLEEIGFRNCLAGRERYPVISDDDIKALNPDLIFLSSEPFPFKERHRAELQELVPSSFVILVDGEMFSWYGSRLTKAPQYFNSLPV